MGRIATLADPICNVPVPPESCAEHGGSMMVYGDETHMKAMIMFVPPSSDENLDRLRVTMNLYMGETLRNTFACLRGHEDRHIPTEQFAMFVTCIQDSMRAAVGSNPLAILLADPGLMFNRRDFDGIQFHMLGKYSNMVLLILPHRAAFT